MKAQLVLGKLYAAGEIDPETLGILARTWMDRYHQTQEKTFLLKSRDLYRQAFDAFPSDYYTGINAASKSLLAGEKETAAQVAKRVQVLVGDKEAPGDYWKTATIAKVQLLQGNFDAAALLYNAAVLAAPLDHGSHEFQLPSGSTAACRPRRNRRSESKDRCSIPRPCLGRTVRSAMRYGTQTAAQARPGLSKPRIRTHEEALELILQITKQLGYREDEKPGLQNAAISDQDRFDKINDLDEQIKQLTKRIEVLADLVKYPPDFLGYSAEMQKLSQIIERQFEPKIKEVPRFGLRNDKVPG